MRHLAPVLTLTLAFTLATITSVACSRVDATPSDPDRDGVRAAVELYFRGHATGDGAYFRRAFHPDARLFWVAGGAFTQRTSGDFAAGAAGKPAPDEGKRVRRVLLIDVAGDTAIAKVELDYPGTRFIDYLSLLKLDGTWVIVNKIFHRASPPAAVRSR